MDNEENEALFAGAEYANKIASLVVGHLNILLEGGFNVELANAMAAALHARLLGLDLWEPEEEVEAFFYNDLEEEEEDD